MQRSKIKVQNDKSKSKIIVRKICRSDELKLLEFEKRNTEKDFRMGSHKGTISLKDVKKSIDIILNSKLQKMVSLVAEIDNKIVGWLELGIKPGILRKHIASVGIEVLENSDANSVRLILLDELPKIARKLKVKILITDLFSGNRNTIEMYKKSGFRVYGKLSKGIKIGSKYFATVQMYREIL